MFVSIIVMTRINRFNTTCHKTTLVIVKFKINTQQKTTREAIHVNASEPNTCSVAKLKRYLRMSEKMTTFVANRRPRELVGLG